MALTVQLLEIALYSVSTIRNKVLVVGNIGPYNSVAEAFSSGARKVNCAIIVTTLLAPTFLNKEDASPAKL